MSACHAQPLPTREQQLLAWEQQLPARESALAHLSPALAEAAMALARGATVTATADALGVHRFTTYNRFKTDAAFKTAVDKTWRERIERANHEMRVIEALALIDLRFPGPHALSRTAIMDPVFCSPWQVLNFGFVSITGAAQGRSPDTIRQNSAPESISRRLRRTPLDPFGT